MLGAGGAWFGMGKRSVSQSRGKGLREEQSYGV
jgi:hypothetical protein